MCCMYIDKPAIIQNIEEQKDFVTFFDQYEEETYYLCNFYPTPITIFFRQLDKEVTFKSVESAFQAIKFYPHFDLIEQFIDLDAREAKDLSRTIGMEKMDPDWFSGKREAVMFHIIQLKFNDLDLKEKLLSTGDTYLVEHAKKGHVDPYWSDNYDGSGQNMMGQILMHVRGIYGGVGLVPPTAGYKRWLETLSS